MSLICYIYISSNFFQFLFNCFSKKKKKIWFVEVLAQLAPEEEKEHFLEELSGEEQVREIVSVCKGIG